VTLGPLAHAIEHNNDVANIFKLLGYRIQTVGLSKPQTRNSQGQIDAHLSFDGQRLQRDGAM
jgi:hypothetical protein